MTDLAVYSALASVAAIATGVQSAVALGVQSAPSSARERWEPVKGVQTGHSRVKNEIRRRGLALVGLAVGLGLVSGVTLVSWASALAGQPTPEPYLVAPLVAVAVLAAGSFVASVWAGVEVFRAPAD